MTLRLYPLLSLLALTACASTSQYTATSSETARVRLVAQGPGNAYFAVAREMKCSRKFGNALSDGDQLLAAVGGASNSYPKFGSPVVLGIPGKAAHPEWTYVEVKMDAKRNTVLHTSFVLQAGLNPNDVRICNSVTAVDLQAGRDYEVVFSAKPQACTVAVFEVRDVDKKVVRETVTPTAGPLPCTEG